MNEARKTDDPERTEELPEGETDGQLGMPEGLNFSRIAYRQLIRNRLAIFGFTVIATVTTVAVLVPFLANDKPYVILTTLERDYRQAFDAWHDAHGKLARRLAAKPPSSDPVATDRRDLLFNLERMGSQLPADQRRQLSQCGEQYRALLTASDFDPAAWDQLDAEIQRKFNPGAVQLAPRYYFPLFRALRPVEVFFLVLYVGALAQWLVRRRLPPTWKRAGWTLALAAAVALIWTVTFPAKEFPVIFKQLATHSSFALFPPVSYGEDEMILEDILQPPTWLIASESRGPNYHVLGTDGTGRDVFSRMIYGARIAMIIGVVAVSIYITIGIVIGACAGFFRGRTDLIVSRFIEIVICFPSLFLIIGVLAYLPQSIINIMVVLGLTGWTGVARLTRGEFLRIVNHDYVSAIQALGGSNTRIIFRHILPNGIGPVLVVASFGIAWAILVESALSFLGMGVPEPHASWGALLYESRSSEGWWMTLFPGLAIFLTVTAWNLFGEGLRDAIDPRLKQ